MEELMLGTTGRKTSRLGFGSSGLMGSMGRQQSLALLETAFGNGIRHFDTAPLYGFGRAEEVLGEFLAGHGGQCTVTTKFGMVAGRANPLLQAARRAATPLLRVLPGLKRRLGAVPALTLETPGPPAVRPPRNSLFTAEQARASLERSLRALRTDRVDVWLLHEVHAQDLVGNETLLRMMEDAVRVGKVGTFGVGSEPWDVQELLREFPAYCSVTQYEWSALNPVVAPEGRFRILHRALSGRFQALSARLQGDAALRRRMGEEVGLDLGERGVLARLMLKASSVLNPESLLLFWSTQPANIEENVRTLADRSLYAPAKRLHEVLRREFAAGRR